MGKVEAKLEKRANILGMKQEFDTLVKPYVIVKDGKPELSGHSTSQLLPEHHIAYKTTKFFRDVLVKEIPEIETGFEFETRKRRATATRGRKKSRRK